MHIDGKCSAISLQIGRSVDQLNGTQVNYICQNIYVFSCSSSLFNKIYVNALYVNKAAICSSRATVEF